VAVNYASNAQEAERTVERLRAAGHTALAVQADVARADQVRTLFDTVERELGQVDVLVNNAGILKTMPLADTTDALFAQTFAVNVQGTFNTLREAAGRLNDGGRIVNFSTTVVATRLPGYAAYTASKAAVEALTGIFAKELRGRQVRVNAVAPGPVATELFFNGKTPEQIAHYAGMPPLERLGEPEDIAKVVSFLAGPDSGWVNGQVLRANGGLA
jgi:3-oxoacyl-[acyl-carrier protein] reductase